MAKKENNKGKNSPQPGRISAADRNPLSGSGQNGRASGVRPPASVSVNHVKPWLAIPGFKSAGAERDSFGSSAKSESPQKY